MGLPFTLAFTAGLVATVNPCGFAMLPAYLSYFMGLEEDDQTPVAIGVWRGLRVGATVTAGSCSACPTRSRRSRAPCRCSWSWSPERSPSSGSSGGVATFVVYGLGMSVLLVIVTLTLSFGKQTLIGRLRRSSQLVNRVSGSIMVLAGGYIVLFWVSALAGDGTTQIAPVVWVERLSSAATNAVAGTGIRLGGVAAALLPTVVWALISRHHHHAATPETEEVPSTGSSEPSR